MRYKIIIPQNGNLKKTECPCINNRKEIKETYFKYLFDESKLNPDSIEKIYLPRNTEETSLAVKEISKNKEKVTVSSSRTGIVGGAVPKKSKCLISLENLEIKPEIVFNKKNNSYSIKTGAQLKLNELQDFINKNNMNQNKDLPGNLYYPVDPTETNASIGGMVSTNASGARTFYYGPTREWVLGIKAVLTDGSILKIKRGQYFSQNNLFRIKMDKKLIDVFVPEIKMPEIKHNAGYYLKNNMDLIDLFVGSEGTLCIITEIELKLTKLPLNSLYLTVFISNNNYLKIVDSLKQAKLFKPFAIEYIDKNSLKLLEEFRKEQKEASSVPALPEKLNSVIYTEIEYKDKNNFNEIYREIEKILLKNNLDPEMTWAGITKKDLDEMKKFRHALPERINSLISKRKLKLPELTKIGTDMSVPDDFLEEMIEFNINRLKQNRLQFYIFGHIGNGHLHINIIPKNLKEMNKAKELYKEFAEKAVKFNGSVSAEHGIGKIKKDFLKIQFNEKELAVMKKIKSMLDPDNILNPGVLF